MCLERGSKVSEIEGWHSRLRSRISSSSSGGSGCGIAEEMRTAHCSLYVYRW